MRWLVPPVLFLACLAVMALLRWLWPVAKLLPPPWSFLGIVPILAGFFVGISGVVQFRRARTNIRPFREADMLVTTGPFRYSRNPMYLGLVFVLVGVWVLLGALSPVLGIVIFVVTADRWYAAGFELPLVIRLKRTAPVKSISEPEGFAPARLMRFSSSHIPGHSLTGVIG